ncbi:hypothetical protein IU459_15050 [Nocardia amamiensis]|uniref:Uncharacterized protein n=1 Tax=Nocardia amamiensis TaxID=404578 RepID=A0ABS0CQJ5_9NOCA|nr:hypothetical protein [Nocardia amamiensis]MBF6298851.1 hypothetical protein [Nocardia amamiensis]
MTTTRISVAATVDGVATVLWELGPRRTMRHGGRVSAISDKRIAELAGPLDLLVELGKRRERR